MGKQNKFLTVSACAAFVLLGLSLLLCSFSWSPLYSFELSLEKLIGTELFSYYTAQLSLTFISISVMSVLSEKNVIIFWENVAESKLIKPVFGCFAAFTCYSIVSNIGSAVGVFFSSTTVFTLFFMINIVVLIFLTHAIIDVYYGKDAKRSKLVKELADDFLSMEYDLNRAYEYKKKIMGLQQRCFQLRGESDFAELGSLYGLYVGNTWMFAHHDAQPFAYALVSTLDTQSCTQFMSMLSGVVRQETLRCEDLMDEIFDALPVTDTDKDLHTVVAELKEAKTKYTSPDIQKLHEKLCDVDSTYFHDCELWKALSDLPNVTGLLKDLGGGPAAGAALNELFDLIKKRLLYLCNMRIIDICLQRGHPEFIKKLMFDYRGRFDNTACFRHDKKIEEYELRRELMHTVFGFHPTYPIVIMWELMYKLLHIAADAPDLYPSTGFYDLPITDVMANWVYSSDTEVSKLLESITAIPK